MEGTHILHEELGAVGRPHVVEVVISDAGDGAGPSVVGEERGVGRGLPAGLVAGVGAAQALVKVRQESADDRVGVVGRWIARLTARDAGSIGTATQGVMERPAIRAAMEASAACTGGLFNLGVVLGLDRQIWLGTVGAALEFTDGLGACCGLTTGSVGVGAGSAMAAG